MDGAKAPHLYPTVGAEQTFQSPEAPTSRKVAWVARKALGVNLAGAAHGADLGGNIVIHAYNMKSFFNKAVA